MMNELLVNAGKIDDKSFFDYLKNENAMETAGDGFIERIKLQ